MIGPEAAVGARASATVGELHQPAKMDGISDTAATRIVRTTPQRIQAVRIALSQPRKYLFSFHITRYAKRAICLTCLGHRPFGVSP